jgi:carbamoyltransferase
MKTIGISGSFDAIAQRRDHLFPIGWSHDAAAVLVEDGRVIFGAEEERMNRIKHTSKAPISSIRTCLEVQQFQLSDIDYFAIYSDESNYDSFIRSVHYGNSEANCTETIRQLAHRLLIEQLDSEVDDSKLVFVPHHLCHAISAYFHSGYEESLVVTFDGGGDGLSGLVAYATPIEMIVLRTSPLTKSLGIFYNAMINMIGFGLFEEYKAMGLAPYGNPEPLRSYFERLYDLLPNGDFAIHWDRIASLQSVIVARKRADSFSQSHCDFAAALQQTLERIVTHVMTHFQRLSGAGNLCLAGGVAHNCSMNGKLLYSGLFQRIFVHPASDDAGCAVGAALYPGLLQQGFRVRESAVITELTKSRSGPGDQTRSQLHSVYWGRDLDVDAVVEQVAMWNNFLECTPVGDTATDTARLLANGSIVGWMQGRSEFGPRALGNRSIVADPRPAKNKDVINSMVKKREAYRPFAPAILEEFVEEYFELPEAHADLSFMTFVLRVRPEKQSLLGATTHVDGTARLQSVSQTTNPCFWQLIDAFRHITGVPILLNTSFNNNAEPIVESLQDGITCLLTSGLNYLVVGNCVVSKKDVNEQAFLKLYPSMPPHLVLRYEQRNSGTRGHSDTYIIANTYDDRTVLVSKPVWELLAEANGTRNLGEIASAARSNIDGATIWSEFQNLWASRCVILKPTANL